MLDICSIQLLIFYLLVLIEMSFRALFDVPTRKLVCEWRGRRSLNPAGRSHVGSNCHDSCQSIAQSNLSSVSSSRRGRWHGGVHGRCSRLSHLVDVCGHAPPPQRRLACFGRSTRLSHHHPDCRFGQRPQCSLSLRAQFSSSFSQSEKH